jgi:acetoin utilization protein AcuB
MMEEYRFHHLPVVIDGLVEGVISDRDIKRVTQPGSRVEWEDLTVGDVCSVRAYIADIHDPLDKVLEAMAQTQIGSVVVTRDAELVGIFTENDACRLFAEFLRGGVIEVPPDQVA